MCTIIPVNLSSEKEMCLEVWDAICNIFPLLGDCVCAIKLL